MCAEYKELLSYSTIFSQLLKIQQTIHKLKKFSIPDLRFHAHPHTFLYKGTQANNYNEMEELIPETTSIYLAYSEYENS